ncbi:DNA-binding protein [Mycolicibacterium conceptionense]|uniref:DNA-binding protein n=1 Tax=Mycolicibacterium conceptionense TaxID=451644 RepID=A0A0J8U493_9MYCO|nr:helix-turn-helix transcriptional regulator [Mycolicibacterium conceptionense]KMV15912.1 DNA-binding protein [Mycolicibacterium conceptionense]
MPVHVQRKFDLPDAAVGDVLKAARMRVGLELRDVAPLANIDWRVLSRIERGERPCRVTELVALSEVYRFKPEVLLRAILGDEKAWDRLSKVSGKR